jgi:hypothetical protein
MAHEASDLASAPATTVAWPRCDEFRPIDLRQATAIDRDDSGVLDAQESQSLVYKGETVCGAIEVD